MAIKSDNVIFYAYQINKRDSWFKFKKNQKKNRKMALLYKNIKNEYQNDNIFTIEESLEVPGVSKYTDNLPKRYFDDLDMC